MELPIDTAVRALTFLAIAISAGVNVWAIRVARSREIHSQIETGDRTLGERISDIDRKLGAKGLAMTDLDKRLSVLETRISHMPTRQDLERFSDELHEQGARLSAIESQSHTTLTTVQQIHGYLLEKQR